MTLDHTHTPALTSEITSLNILIYPPTHVSGCICLRGPILSSGLEPLASLSCSLGNFTKTGDGCSGFTELITALGIRVRGQAPVLGLYPR